MRLLTVSIAFAAGLLVSEGLSWQQESEVEDICTDIAEEVAREVASQLISDHDNDPVMAHYLFGAEPAAHEH